MGAGISQLISGRTLADGPPFYRRNVRGSCVHKDGCYRLPGRPPAWEIVCGLTASQVALVADRYHIRACPTCFKDAAVTKVTWPG
jgi:hypothetical protein